MLELFFLFFALTLVFLLPQKVLNSGAKSLSVASKMGSKSSPLPNSQLNTEFVGFGHKDSIVGGQLIHTKVLPNLLSTDKKPVVDLTIVTSDSRNVYDDISELLDLRQENLTLKQYAQCKKVFGTEENLFKEAQNWYCHHQDKTFLDYVDLKTRISILF